MSIWEYAISLMATVISVIGAILTPNIKQFLVSRFGINTTNTLITLTIQAVQYAEQKLQGMPNSTKKEAAIAALQAAADSRKLKISPTEIETFIESAVLNLPKKLDANFGYGLLASEITKAGDTAGISGSGDMENAKVQSIQQESKGEAAGATTASQAQTVVSPIVTAASAPAPASIAVSPAASNVVPVPAPTATAANASTEVTATVNPTI